MQYEQVLNAFTSDFILDQLGFGDHTALNKPPGLELAVMIDLLVLTLDEVVSSGERVAVLTVLIEYLQVEMQESLSVPVCFPILYFCLLPLT